MTTTEVLPPLLPPAATLAWLAPVDAFARFEKPRGAWASSDAAWVYRYLCNGCGSQTTRKAVQGEMLRLAFFMRREQIETLADLTSDDAAAYRNWLATEKPTFETQAKPVPRFLNGQWNPAWRPFRTPAPLAINAQKTALRLISGCLSFLQDDPSCPVSSNPFRRVAKAVEQEKKSIVDLEDDDHLYTKALSAQALEALFAYLESDAFRGSERSRTAKRWLLTLAFETAVRVETIVQLSTANLFPDPANPGQWRLRFRAKHNSRVDQPWTQTLQNGFQQYCRAFAINNTSDTADKRPLWFGVKTFESEHPLPVQPSSVWAMLRGLGKQTEQWLRNEQSQATENLRARFTERDYAQLNALHPHTLRHTWCTHAINIHGHDLLYAKAHLGHSSVTVTERYQWAEY